MRKKKKSKSLETSRPSVAESTEVLLCDFGSLSRANISDLFVDIHASVSPLDPLNKMKADVSSN